MGYRDEPEDEAYECPECGALTSEPEGDCWRCPYEGEMVEIEI